MPGCRAPVRSKGKQNFWAYSVRNGTQIAGSASKYFKVLQSFTGFTDALKSRASSCRWYSAVWARSQAKTLFRSRQQLQIGCTRFGSNVTNLGFQLRLQQRLEGVTVFGKFFDALVELVERHGVLEKGPSELGFIVDESDFGDGSGRSG